MTKVEKREFARVVEARTTAGNPVSAAEVDLVVDYVTSRSRISLLRKLLGHAFTEPDDRKHYPSQKHAAALIRQIDTTTSMSRRLARALHLTEQPAKGAAND
jgi:hypothetical protein